MTSIMTATIGPLMKHPHYRTHQQELKFEYFLMILDMIFVTY